MYEVDKFVAVGITKALIHPNLGDMKEGEELETMISMMRLSSELSPYVCPPYRCIDTVNLEYTTLGE